ncbi:MAG: lytic transglycosylase domain-containing protein [Actinomycetota bacterium]|nr:lytic transglycosylase domain-containing protein [Actinomycetota bacterium]
MTFTACDAEAPEEERRAARSIESSEAPGGAPEDPGPSEPADETPDPETSSPASGKGAYVLGARLPGRPASLSRALERVHADLSNDVDRWLARGGALHGPLVARIQREALFQQRLYRKMARDPRLARASLRLLDGPLRRRATANFEAGYGLSAGLQPLEPPIRLETIKPEPPKRLLSFYEEAQRRYRVDWTILAAINFIETRFGRILGPSPAGALGPMQFLPSTWKQYGNGGDIRDPRDAILGAARYLRASNVLTNPRAAVFAYNRSDAYVEAVLTYARQMAQRPQTFYEYYFWQVFVRTTKGDVQLTGPGATDR